MEVNRLTHEDIDFERVQELFGFARSEMLTEFNSDEYSDEERQIALQYDLEYTLWDLRIQVIDAFIVKMMQKGVPFGKDMFVLLQPLFELSLEEAGTEQREALLPLFFSPDLKTKGSLIIDDEELRDALFEVYEKVIRREGKEVSELKRLYHTNYPFSYLMPFGEHVASAKKTKRESADGLPEMPLRDAQVSAHKQLDEKNNLEVEDIPSIKVKAETTTLRNVLSSTLFLSGKVLLLLFAWATIFVAWPRSGKVELPIGVQWLLAIGATIWIWNGANAWRDKRRKRR